MVVLVAVARLESPAAVGDLGLALALAAPLFMLAEMNLRDLLATDVERQRRFADYLALRLLGVGLAVVVSILLALVTTGPALVVALVALAKVADSVGDIVYGFLQRDRRLGSVGRSMLFRGVAQAVLVPSVLVVSGGLVPALVAMAASSIVVLVVHDVPTVRGEITRVQRVRATDLAALARLAAPLGVVALLVSASTVFPRYFLEWHGSRAEVGYFVAIAYTLNVLGLVNLSVSQAAIAELADRLRLGHWPFVQLLWRLSLGAGVAGLVAVVVAVVAGERLLRIVFPPTYASFAGVLVWLTVARVASLMGSYVKAALVAMRVVGPQTVPIAAGLALGCMAAAAWIPQHGLLGAAWAAAVTSWTSLSLNVALVVRRLASTERLAWS